MSKETVVLVKLAKRNTCFLFLRLPTVLAREIPPFQFHLSSHQASTEQSSAAFSRDTHAVRKTATHYPTHVTFRLHTLIAKALVWCFLTKKASRAAGRTVSTKRRVSAGARTSLALLIRSMLVGMHQTTKCVSWDLRTFSSPIVAPGVEKPVI